MTPWLPPQIITHIYLAVNLWPGNHTLSELKYTDNLNPCFVHVTNTSRKAYLLSCSFSVVNCIDGQIEFT